MIFDMTTARAFLRMPRRFAFYSLVALAALSAACGGDNGEGAPGGGPGGPGGGIPPMPVEASGPVATARPVTE